jgi:hypothetical protein
MKVLNLFAPVAIACLMALPAAAQTATQTVSLQLQPGTFGIANNGAATHSFTTLTLPQVGPTALTLTSSPSFTVTDNTGSFAGWKVQVQAAPQVGNPQVFPNHLFYTAGAGATLTPSSVNALVEGTTQGTGSSGTTVSGSQDIEGSPLTLVSAAADATSAGVSTYTMGTTYSLDVGTAPLRAGTYSWTLTATLTSTP